MPRKSSNNIGFRRILYDIIEFEQQTTVPAICLELSRRYSITIATSTFYKYLNGDLICPPDVVRGLCFILRDPRLIGFFVPKDMRVYKLPKDKDTRPADAIELVAGIMEFAGRLVERAAMSLEEESPGGSEITRREAEEIDKSLKTLQAKLATFGALLDRIKDV